MKKYPLLTTRKQCQLKFAEQCLEYGTRDFFLENKEFMYKEQPNMISYNENNFVIPDYFPA